MVAQKSIHFISFLGFLCVYWTDFFFFFLGFIQHFYFIIILFYVILSTLCLYWTYRAGEWDYFILFYFTQEQRYGM